jgi:two-component system response regulator FixJ
MSKRPGTVLIVDDDAAVRSALKFALEVEGFTVRLYAGPEALLADADLPCHGCLIIDYRMPIMDGLELIGALRKRHFSMPAILITGHANNELRRLAAKWGVRQVLEKPLSDGALIDGIRQAFGACG